MNYYSNLPRVRSYLRMDAVASADVSDDPELLRLLKNASRSIDQYTRRRFYPRRETRFYDFKKTAELRLDDDLLELVTFKTSNGDTTLASGVMWLAAGDNWNYRPANRIVLSREAGCVLQFSGTGQRANEVTGLWGYHEDWADAWVDTGASLSRDYAASGTVLDLAGLGSAASDVNGEYPKFGVGDLLKIGDEYFAITGPACAASLNDVKVVPYRNGTAAASHGSGASIAKFSPEPDVEWACIRLVGWAWGQKDAPYTEKTGNTLTGTFSVPSAWPSDIRDKLNRFKRFTLEVFPEE